MLKHSPVVSGQAKSATITPIGTGYNVPQVRRPGGRPKLPPGVVDFRKAKIPHQRARMLCSIEAAMHVEYDRRHAGRQAEREAAYQSLVAYLVDARIEQLNRASRRPDVLRMPIDLWVQIYAGEFDRQSDQARQKNELSGSQNKEFFEKLAAALNRSHDQIEADT